jgi:hypothetical protein
LLQAETDFSSLPLVEMTLIGSLPNLDANRHDRQRQLTLADGRRLTAEQFGEAGAIRNGACSHR